MNDSPLPTTLPTAVVVDVQSAWVSKINWTQLVAAASTLGVLFGLPELDPKQQLTIVGAIQLIGNGITWYLRTYRSTTVTVASAKKL